IVDGQLTTRSYVDQTGQKKWTTEVTLSGFKGSIQLINSQGEFQGDVEIGKVTEPVASQTITCVASDEFEDDIPF
ncbi:MAG TPA: single-stranded DNA-binding protein, partial [Xanthomarina gelatinilytica]|nr:single-stranded DNA-binding protein [Xanthomarina gelatinilytica]